MGCDGTNVNVGENGGIIRLMENTIQRPLQWFVCLLHQNELPLRHLMKRLDGPTTGPNAFSGPIGKELQTCELIPIKRFRRIQVELPGIDPAELSSDQQYLLRIVRAVSDGQCPPELAQTKPSPVNHARWLTLGCRVIRLYMTKSSPSARLRKIASYVAQVYAAQWFDIKLNSSCAHGARHLYSLVQRVKKNAKRCERHSEPNYREEWTFCSFRKHSSGNAVGRAARRTGGCSPNYCKNS